MTSEETSRGLIGRGVKDILNIGNVTFTLIKNGFSSSVLLNQNLSSFIIFENNQLIKKIKLL